MNTQEAIGLLKYMLCDIENDAPNGKNAIEAQALTHAIEVMKRGQWQTMESAPRDGVECLYWDRRYETVLIAKRGMSDMPQTGDWEYELDATHWMPLPDAPEVKQ